jgi:hypothetical protein
MVAIVLPDNLLAVELPKASVVIRTSGDQVRRISTESTVPYPPLMASQCSFAGVRFGFLILDRIHVDNLPNLCSVVGTAGCKLLYIWREEYARNILLVGAEMGDGNQLCAI